jgi:hypothetical protein
MASTSVVFEILAQDRASSKFDAFGRSVDGAGNKVSKLGTIAKSAAKAGIFALGAGAVVAAKGLYDMAQAAVEDEAAASRLAQTLKNTAGATDAQVASVERWITAQGQALGVTDDELRPAMQRLAEATGDVTKAQGLASLAMDVSAGTGRSLKAVSEALLRAHNGSVGGLSRYGIATKDAKGETLSFEAVTRKMAETFKGQAEKNADTLSGKLGRLKVILSETGEEIGGKLLPYVADAADAFMNKGVPAIEAFGDKAGPVFSDLIDKAGEVKDAVQPAFEEIAEALGNLAGEGDAAGKIFNNVFMPALRGTADTVAGVVDFIDDLPGPIKDVGIQAGIAALVLPKLTGAVAASTGAMSAMAFTATNAAARTAALAKAAKTAAGVGGMVALADGVGQTNDALRGLEMAGGGALLGFAAGGPYGAAIGFGVGALLSMKDVSAETEKNFRVFGDTLDDYKVSVDAASASVTALTREQIAQNLIMSGAAEAGRVEGLSLRQLVDATLGQRDALDAVGGAYAENSGQVFQWIDAQGVLQTRAVKSRDDVDRLTAGVARNAKEIIGVSDANQVLRNSLGDQSAAFRQSTREARMAALAAQDLRGQWGKIPDRIETTVRAEGIPVTLRGMAALANRYNLTPKQIKTLIGLSGTELSLKKVRELQGELDETDRKRPKPKLDADERPLRGAVDDGLRLLLGLDKEKAIPEAGLSLQNFYQSRAELLASLNNIPDEQVSVWVTRRDVNPGGPGPQDSDGLRRMAATTPSPDLPDPAPKTIMAPKRTAPEPPAEFSPSFASRFSASAVGPSAEVRSFALAKGARGQSEQMAAAVRAALAGSDPQPTRTLGGQTTVVVRDRFPDKVTLRVGDRSFDAYIDERASNVSREEIRDERRWLRTQE